MKIIALDASKWRTARDFYDALLRELQAPQWHGKNINALIDSMIWGGINELKPPYEVRITNLAAAASEAREEALYAIDAIERGLQDRKAWRGDDVPVSIVAAD